MAAVLACSACATAEEIEFGEPDRAVGGTSGGGVIAGGEECIVDEACAVSWATDVYPVLATKAKCGSSGCHAVSTAGFEFPNAPVDAYSAVVFEVYQGSLPYVAPCFPEASKLLCNLRLEGGELGAYGTCGSPMPKAIDDSVDDAPLTLAELQTIEAWIVCGAPEN